MISPLHSLSSMAILSILYLTEEEDKATMGFPGKFFSITFSHSLFVRIYTFFNFTLLYIKTKEQMQSFYYYNYR